MHEMILYLAGVGTIPVVLFLIEWVGRLAAEARRNFRPEVNRGIERRYEAVSIMLSTRFFRVRLPGARVIYVRSNVPAFGNPGTRLLNALSEAVEREPNGE